MRDAKISQPFVITRQGDEHQIVLKRGRTIGLTVGVALDVESVVRMCSGPGRECIESSKWTIIDIRQTDARIDFLNNSQPWFSEGGDSGAIIFDLNGQVGRMITGGTTDVRGTICKETMLRS